MGYDAVVVGAGPAGAAATWGMGCRGLRVVLVDRARFPRPKPCGDGISPSAVALLEEVGLVSCAELERRFQRIDRVRLVAGADAQAVGGSRLNRKRADGRPFPGIVAPREVFDHLLLDRAAARAAEVVTGEGVTEVLYRDGRARGVRLASGRCLDARVVVGADGSHSVVRRSLGLGPQRLAFAIRTYVEGADPLPPDCLEVHKTPHLGRGYAWVFPTGPGSANVGLGCRAEILRASGISLQRALQGFMEAHPGLRGTRRVGPTRGWPLPLGSCRFHLHGPGVLLCGDAGGLVDPMSGEGIYHAVRSGLLAADAVQEYLGSGDAALPRYSRRVAREFRAEYCLGLLFSELAELPGLLRWVLRRAALHQRLADTLAALFGHGNARLPLLSPLRLVQLSL